ncbi:MAG TPA: sensor histidine kinase [Nitrolancea sp.]|nr:sensor histidine kinase [Nitrolancea sp.]
MTAAVPQAPPYRFRAKNLRNPFRLLISAEPWINWIFMNLSFAIGLFWFIVLVVLIAVGAGMAITLVGLPMLAGTLILWTYGARLERYRVNSMLGTKIRNPYRPLPDGSNWDRFKTRARDPHTWLDLLYLFILFPIGIVEFALAAGLIWWIGLLLSLPLTYRIADGFDFFTWRVDTFGESWFVALIAIPFLFAMPYVFVGVGRGHAWIARMLLGVNREAELTERVGELTESRSRMADASVSELRRIERDLHDGAQQRLVKLSMDLGLAREKLSSDPALAEQLVAEAHEEAKRAMAEIRDLARGIHPAILTDRGLDAAISALAGRSPVPVTVDVCLSERLPSPVESTAYFIVAEALTNIARHSQATEACVILKREGDMLQIDVVDDGVGGADPERGTGLSGLRDRVAAFDGTLTVNSPEGGPTRVHAELRFGS